MTDQRQRAATGTAGALYLVFKLVLQPNLDWGGINAPNRPPTMDAYTATEMSIWGPSTAPKAASSSGSLATSETGGPARGAGGRPFRPRSRHKRHARSRVDEEQPHPTD